MEVEKKSLWLTLGSLALGIVVSLVGAFVGKSVLGWILFAVGLVLVVAVVIIRLSIFKTLFSSKRTWTLIGGILLVLLIAASAVIMLTAKSAASGRPSANGNFPPQGTPGAGGPQASATATAIPATAIPTVITATATAERTARPAATTVSSIYVCLNENTRIGYNMRIAPAKDAAFGGKLDPGACFYVDGKAAGVPGWYHLTRGQNGSIGVAIYVDENKYQLWVDGYYLESFGNDLTSLPDLTVISQ